MKFELLVTLLIVGVSLARGGAEGASGLQSPRGGAGADEEAARFVSQFGCSPEVPCASGLTCVGYAPRVAPLVGKVAIVREELLGECVPSSPSEVEVPEEGGPSLNLEEGEDLT